MKEILIRAPSTIANLGPGFDIFALALEHPYIELKMCLTDTKSITIKADGCREDIPLQPEKNCAGIAMLDLLKRIDSNIGVVIELKKAIRVGAGLGSTGACASGCVYGLNRLLDLHLNHNEIIEIASRGEVASGGVAHADNVAGSLLGGFVIVKSYNPIDVVKIDAPDIPFVIGVLKKTERTTRPLIPKSLQLDKVREQLSRCAQVVHAITHNSLKEFGEAISKDFISEPVRSRSIPRYDDLKKKILEGGAYGCNISGGGLSIFAVCEKKRTNDLAEIMKAEFAQRNIENEVIITRTNNEGIREISVS